MGSRLAAVLWSSLNSSLVCSVVSILKGGIETSKCLLICSYLSGVAFLIPEQLLGAYVVRDWPFCYYKMPSMTFLLFEGPLACPVLNPGPRAWDTLPPSYLPALFSCFLSRLGSLCCSGLDSPFASASHRAESPCSCACSLLSVSTASVGRCAWAPKSSKQMARSRTSWAQNKTKTQNKQTETPMGPVRPLSWD